MNTTNQKFYDFHNGYNFVTFGLIELDVANEKAIVAISDLGKIIVKKLTGKGYEYATNNYFAHYKKLHENIMTCNLFSALPYFSRLVGAY